MTTAAQLRAARAMLNLKQPEVAEAALVSVPTLKRAEGSGRPPASVQAVAYIREALERRGVVFLDPADGHAGGVAWRRGAAKG